jgi:hypothetical protein
MNRREYDSRANQLAVTPGAAAMARQLAEPDGKVIFTEHPLSNSVARWAVHGDGARGSADPIRQLLAYGLGEIAAITPPLIERDDWGNPERFDWQIVLTERGRSWVRAGYPLDIQPPASGQHNRRRRAA